ncbi:hypothetical protein DL764_008484 [Monosporascus ibericus]|uniref:Uncharacterized protein n=1 Tax=Monosporascus ibericus TaxID=155417 RepID=A0A4Q4SXD1_9PEZI|nr:hypothetical protein DL764_008484 [Monosporascus ibericus]
MENGVSTNVTNSLDCKTTYVSFSSFGAAALMLYIGYHGSAYADPGLESSDCSTGSSHRLLIAWSSIGSNATDPHLTALFCETRYWKQNVFVTISADSLKPQDNSLTPLGPPEVLTEDEFNSTAFEFLLNNGVPADFELGYSKNTSFFERVDTAWRVADYPLSGRVKPMVGFALGGHPLPLEKYDNETELLVAFEKAHQLLFAVAINRILQDQAPESGPIGSVSSIHYGLVVSRTFAAAVEGLLLLIAVLGSFLLYLCRRSPSHLDSDPGSIEVLLNMVRNSQDIKYIFCGKDFTDEMGLRQGLDAFRFSLREATNDTSPTLEVTVTDQDKSILIGQVRIDEDTLRGHYKPEKPMALQPGTGVLFVFAMALVIALLCYLRRVEVAQGDNAYPTALCHGVFVMGWGRSIASNGTSKGVTNSSFVACEPAVISRFFEVAIDHEGHVLSAEVLDETDETSYELDPASVANLTLRMNYFLQQNKCGWHSDVRTQDWMHYLFKVLDDDNSALVNPSEDVPDPQVLIPLIERVYRQAFAALLYTAPQIFDEFEQGGPLVAGKRDTTETRLFMVRGAFVISTLVLAVNIITATFIYWRGTMVYLPRMPTTIASLLGYTAASRLASGGWERPRDGKDAVSSQFRPLHWL